VSYVVWLTGLSSAGKTTLANDLAYSLRQYGREVLVLDGDNVRQSLCSDLGYDQRDRSENTRRVASIAAIASAQDIVVIVALMSPFTADRAQAVSLIGRDRFVMVWVDTELDICKMRDSKGLYERAQRGEIDYMIGIDVPYEPPSDCMRISGNDSRRKNIEIVYNEISARFGD